MLNVGQGGDTEAMIVGVKMEKKHEKSERPSPKAVFEIEVRKLAWDRKFYVG